MTVQMVNRTTGSQYDMRLVSTLEEYRTSVSNMKQKVLATGVG